MHGNWEFSVRGSQSSAWSRRIVARSVYSFLAYMRARFTPAGATPEEDR